MPTDEEARAFLSWRLLALGACGLVLTLGGLAVGLWSQSLDQRLDDIAKVQFQQWQIIQQRAGLAQRLDATERQAADQEQRLREVERQIWGRRH